MNLMIPIEKLTNGVIFEIAKELGCKIEGEMENMEAIINWLKEKKFLCQENCFYIRGSK